MSPARVRGNLRQGREADLPQIVKDFPGQTVITTFATGPATAFDLAVAPEAVAERCIRLRPGFIAAARHLNNATARSTIWAAGSGR